MKYSFYHKFYRVLFISLVCINGCNNNSPDKLTGKDISEGMVLSQTYCKTCHMLPDPALLNKTTWVNYVLPKMGEMAGFRHLGLSHYVENGNNKLMDLEQWKKIVDYYSTRSPEKLPRTDAKTLKTTLTQFTSNSFYTGIEYPSTTMVNAGEAGKGFYFGDGLEQKVYSAGAGHIVDSFAVGKGISALRLKDRVLMVLTMGVLKPSDSKAGSLTAINGINKQTSIILDSLQRPVHAAYADLNDDRREDIIICEFGNNTGCLAWYENKGGNKYSKHVLRPLPGAVKSDVYDFNGDGLPDIIAMLAQGDEGIFIYYNQGNNTFREQRVLQLPPSYGSNYFELVDFNSDGYPDILATNGDNGDYPPLLKAYHGIRIYLNDGKSNFSENQFLPVNGASKAIARDFDKDGDIDIASVAFFPDYNQPGQDGFCYWENKGDLKFEPRSFSNPTSGRWLTMDAGDLDKDGDLDIVLGNAVLFIGSLPDSQKLKMSKTGSVLLLKNNLR